MEIEQEKAKKSLFQDVCAGIVHIIFAALFGSFISDSSYYGDCSEKSSTYHWSKIAFIFHLTIIGCSLVISPLFTFIFIRSEGKLSFLFKLMLFIRFVCLVLQLTSYGGICYAYGEHEDCYDSDLGRLNLAYIILNSIGLGLGLLVVCCGIICGGALLGLASLSTANQLGGLNKQLESLDTDKNNNANSNSQQPGPL
jgi:hypothetical protein